MLNTLNDVLNNVDNFIWGMPLIILILFTGILLTVRLRGLQVRHLGKALHYVFHNEDDGEGEVTSFGALCTALSATIGTGNIVGCATAIVAGDQERYSGCGWQHFLVWLPNMPKVF